MKIDTIRKISGITLIAASLIFGMTSCKKSNSGGGAGISANIGGQNFQSAYTLGIYSGNYIDITGTGVRNKDSVGMELYWTNKVKIGTASPFSDYNAYVDYYDANQNDYSSTTASAHGTFTLNSIDSTGHKVSGTFSGVLYADANDSITITNGSFNATYLVY